ncbi:hypothetical protein JRQ81_016498 [Phrynocephalus forsythii]|uniref:4Fe-4S ferredoxin-type domain-containing protein n=1 Tax=Phrynocephalus forsythii TaxID=171643 RepID=A0A9Q1B0M8_9SAUR|nr:hypothetical protein JRQ81_016498 [Phrynocephalus forsythii]
MVDGMWWAVFPICNSCGTCNPSCPHPRSEDDPFLYIDPQMTDQDGKVYMHLNCQLKIKETHANKWGLLKTAKKNPQSKERQEPECKRNNGWISIPVEWPSWVPG